MSLCTRSRMPTHLPANAVHIWQRPLVLPPTQLEQLAASLSPEERQRLESCRLARQRTTWIAVRGTLRLLLGHYLDQSPGALSFCYTPDGKPYLAGDAPRLSFNVTHSGQWGLYAISRSTELGVDLEQIRPMPPEKSLRLARRFFSSAEYAALSGLPPEQVQEAFFACWSRKEAYIKRHGLSMARLLAQFSVTVDPVGPPVLLETPWRPADVAHCRLYDLPAPTGYRAALALASSEPFDLRYAILET
ncbi:MAG: 4'-phosphopantetheinyl transferase superfamily protein [Magnetococcales bacterium]|nr:4'-phosphopantetheinyl transferase superfamily protein [Magnetococcales bacterium]